MPSCAERTAELCLLLFPALPAAGTRMCKRAHSHPYRAAPHVRLSCAAAPSLCFSPCSISVLEALRRGEARTVVVAGAQNACERPVHEGVPTPTAPPELLQWDTYPPNTFAPQRTAIESTFSVARELASIPWLLHRGCDL